MFKWTSFFDQQMQRLTNALGLAKRLAEQNNRQIDQEPMLAVRQILLCQQNQIQDLTLKLDAQQRGMAVVLEFLKNSGNHLHHDLELALQVVPQSDEIDPYVVQTADDALASDDAPRDSTSCPEYDNWRWKMNRMSGLTGTKVLDYENVMLRLSPDHNNPDAVFVNNIKTQRSFELLYQWARNYFGSCYVGGGQRPDGTWWVRIDHWIMKNRMLDYPSKGRVK